MREGMGARLWLAGSALALGLYVAWNEPLARFARVLLPLLLGSLLAIGMAGWGWWIVARFRRSPLEEALGAFAAGTALTSLIVQALGSSGVWTPWLGAIWIVVGLALGTNAVRRRWPAWRAVVVPWTRLDSLALVLVVPFLVQGIPYLLTPPASTDELEFHLLIPKLWLDAGRITALPFLVEASYPSLVEHVFFLTLPLAGDVACRVLHFLAGIGAALALSALARRVAPQGTRFLAPVLFLTLPVVACNFGWALNDAHFTLFLLLALLGLVDYDRDAASRHLLWAGLFAGCAAITKYTFAMVAMALAGFLLWALWRWRWRWRDLPAFLLPVGLLPLTWLIKNWRTMGNPFHPFLDRWFHSPHWSAAADAYFKGTLTRFEMTSWNWTTYFTFPFRLTLAPRVIDAHLGVVPLLLLPLALLVPGARVVKAYAAFYMTIWLLVVQTEVRSFLSVVAVVLVLGVAGFERWVWPRYPRAATLVLALATAAALLITGVTTWHLSDPLRYAIGLQSRADYLIQEARSQKVYDWLDEQPTVERVLLIGMHAPYELEKPALFTSCCDPPLIEKLVAGARDSDEIARRLRALGVTHIAFAPFEYRREHDEGLYSWSAADRRRFETFMGEATTKVAGFGGEFVFQLNPATSPAAPVP